MAGWHSARIAVLHLWRLAIDDLPEFGSLSVNSDRLRQERHNDWRTGKRTSDEKQGRRDERSIVPAPALPA
jgi:hypothetical protein